jgi:hypothetical protein
VYWVGAHSDATRGELSLQLQVGVGRQSGEGKLPRRRVRKLAQLGKARTASLDNVFQGRQEAALGPGGHPGIMT